MSVLTDLFANIANAIRTKTGSSDTITASDFPTAIANIPSGGVFKPTKIQFPADTTGSQLQDMLDDPALDFTELLSCVSMISGMRSNVSPQLDLSRHTFPKATTINNMFSNSYFTYIVFNQNAFKSGAVVSAYSMFRDMSYLANIDLSCIDFSNIASISEMFRNCTHLTSINFGNADLSGVTNISGFFNTCERGTQQMALDFISCLTGNTSIKSFSSLFYRYGINNNELTNLDISGIPSINVTDMNSMFADYAANAYVQKQLTIGELDCGKVNTINNIFYRCGQLIKINGKFKDLGKAYSNTTVHLSTYKLDLSSTAIDHDSLVNIIDGLYDLNTTYASQGKSLARQELKLGSTLSAKLSAAEIQVATDKGWDVT